FIGGLQIMSFPKIKSIKGDDKTGPERGARGLAGKDDAEFLKPNFNRARQVGPLYVGYYNAVTDNAQLEGDDVGNWGIDGGDDADFRRTSRNDGVAGKNQ